MATYCSHCLGAICDFCIWYDFNGDDEGTYTGNGYCRFYKWKCNPEDGFGCDEFHCHSAREGDSFSEVQKRNWPRVKVDRE